MKAVSTVVGAIMLYGGGFYLWFAGTMWLWESLDILGALIAIFMFPIAVVVGLFGIHFTSIVGFIVGVLWYGIGYLLVALGDE